MKRIFYCNITYGCNSNCVFCYSHNTWHNSIPHNEIDLENYLKYLEKYRINKDDRIIINGGEPTLFTKINDLLIALLKYDCEVLIYTNGRLLGNLNVNRFCDKYRFIIPIHGYRELHDNITGVYGSYDETLCSLKKISKSVCKTDIKIIINHNMVADEYSINKTIKSLEGISFNHAVHITKMANTKVSKMNGCRPITNIDAAIMTNNIFKYFMDKCKVKFFDTCIAELCLPNNLQKTISEIPELTVYYKDYNQERLIELVKSNWNCRKNCERANICMSAVDEFKVLEFYKNNIYISLE